MFSLVVLGSPNLGIVVGPANYSLTGAQYLSAPQQLSVCIYRQAAIVPRSIEVCCAESEGGEPQSPAPKKTRRGKRGGRNQKLRAESMKQMGELSRASVGRASVDLASVRAYA